eukprot:tig00020610_g12094.t1
MSSSIVPTLLWAQRKKALYVTVDVKEPVIAEDGKSVAADGTFKFAGSSNGKSYAVECQLHDEVVAEEPNGALSPAGGVSRVSSPSFANLRSNLIPGRSAEKTHGAWPRLLKEKKPFVKCDWDLWIEEDDWKFDDTRASSGAYDNDFDFGGATSAAATSAATTSAMTRRREAPRHRREGEREAAAEAAAGEEVGGEGASSEGEAMETDGPAGAKPEEAAQAGPAQEAEAQPASA